MLPLIPTAIVAGSVLTLGVHYSVDRVSRFLKRKIDIKVFWSTLEECYPDAYRECRAMQKRGDSMHKIGNYAAIAVELEIKDQFSQFSFT